METSAAVIAVAVNELEQFGCPYCGYCYGHSSISNAEVTDWICGECHRRCFVLARGVQRSTIAFEKVERSLVYPELQGHPRHGIPSHRSPDKRPENGGEFFNSRGIGTEYNMTCFCCGTRDLKNRPDRYQTGNGILGNIAAFVQCKAAGERVIGMFKQGARLDYREIEPDRVQVKVGACKTHHRNLKQLRQLTSDGIITSERVAQAMA